jgi:transcriptional regulator with XRE-family HTH domain
MAFVDKFKTLRVNAGLSIKKVADAAHLSSDTISKIERHIHVRPESCAAAINALNDLYYTARHTPLDPNSLITATTALGEGRPRRGEPPDT